MSRRIDCQFQPPLLPVLSLRDISFGYAKDKPILENISLKLFAGQSIGLFGRNGSGKTSLFRCITGLNRIWNGQIMLHGQEIKSEKDFTTLRQHIGFAVQNAEDQIFFATALEDVSFGPLNLGLDAETANKRAAYWLEKTGLGGMEKRECAQLSGGQQKLLALAGIFAMEPDALLLDEPFNGLDEHAVKTILELLENLQAAKIIVCHDWKLLRQITDDIYELKNGHLEGRPA